MSYDAICGVVYTNPEAAFVGMSEEQAKASGRPYKVKKVSINFSGRHVAENGMSNGLCKLILDAEKKHADWSGADVLLRFGIYLFPALMIDLQVPVDRILRTVFPHPTVCEGDSRSAAEFIVIICSVGVQIQPFLTVLSLGTPTLVTVHKKLTEKFPARC